MPLEIPLLLHEVLRVQISQAGIFFLSHNTSHCSLKLKKKKKILCALSKKLKSCICSDHFISKIF